MSVTCLLKLILLSRVTPSNLRCSFVVMSQLATVKCVGGGAHAWRCTVPIMMTSNLSPFSISLLPANQC